MYAYVDVYTYLPLYMYRHAYVCIYNMLPPLVLMRTYKHFSTYTCIYM